jgi:outer membrane protein assembly factor BamB
MSRRLHSILLLSSTLVGTGLVAGPASPGFTYFRSDGGVAGPAAGPLPDDFDAPGALRWKAPLDPGQSTPILVGGKIFLTTFNAESKELATVALDAASGQVLWRKPAPVARVEAYHPKTGSPAPATPACDGERLYVFFGSYGLICYGLDGQKLWEQPMGPFQDEYGAGSSPMLFEDKVIVSQDHDIGSFVVAFDRVTGKQVWKTARPDAVRSYSTPAIWNRNGRNELLVAGALELTSYDPGTGAQLWSAQGLARIVIPTPVIAGDTIYMASWSPGGDAGSRISLGPWSVALEKWDKNKDGKLSRSEVGDPNVLDRFFRMDLDGDGLLDQKEWERHAEVFNRAQNAVLALKPSSTHGELRESDVVWKHTRGVPYVATPLLDKNILWLVKDGGIVTKLDATTGRLLQEERVPGIGSYYASPVTGDGKVYFASEQGAVTVVANVPEWRVISSHAFHEKIYATPLIDRNRVFLRTEKGLYCFQGKPKPLPQ